MKKKKKKECCLVLVTCESETKHLVFCFIAVVIIYVWCYRYLANVI